MERPEYFVAPDKVRKMNAKQNIEIAAVKASLVSAKNCSAYKLFLTYSIITNAFIRMKTQCEAKCSLDLITAKFTKVICIAKIDPIV